MHNCNSPTLVYYLSIYSCILSLFAFFKDITYYYLTYMVLQYATVSSLAHPGKLNVLARIPRFNPPTPTISQASYKVKLVANPMDCPVDILLYPMLHVSLDVNCEAYVATIVPKLLGSTKSWHMVRPWILQEFAINKHLHCLPGPYHLGVLQLPCRNT